MKLRNRLTAVAAALTVTAALTTACGGGSAPSLGGDSSNAVSADEYTTIVNGGPTAADAEIAASPWAKAIKDRGKLIIGGTDVSQIFSLRDPKTGNLIGFDAGLGQLLSRYITGKSFPGNTDLKITTVDTRETMLQNKTVDAVFATYTITEARAQKVAFAGPYYESGAAVLVKKDNTTIKSVADLAGKNIATESGSTSITAIEKNIPNAKVTLFDTDDKCVAAVQQGRVDAYVLDQAILLSDAAKNPNVKVVGEPFTEDPYGIGLPKEDPTAKEFVKAFLSKIYQDGTWAKLFGSTVGKYIEGGTPTPPVLGSVAGS